MEVNLLKKDHKYVNTSIYLSKYTNFLIKNNDNKEPHRLKVKNL